MAVSLTVDTSDILDGELIDEADVTTPIGQLKTALEDTLNGVQAFYRLSFGAAESKTIASGAITIGSGHVDVNTEAAAASDDLDTINGTADGRILILRNTGGNTVVIKHNVGNIYTADGTDYDLDSAQKFCVLLYVTSSLRWLLLAGGGGGGLNYSDVMYNQVFS